MCFECACTHMCQWMWRPKVVRCFHSTLWFLDGVSWVTELTSGLDSGRQALGLRVCVSVLCAYVSVLGLYLAVKLKLGLALSSGLTGGIFCQSPSFLRHGTCLFLPSSALGSCPSFLMGLGPTSGPHACAESTLPSEPSHQPHWFWPSVSLHVHVS